MSDDVTHVSDTISRIHLGDREFILVGTAHISRQSVEEVEGIIREERPERVCVEIDQGRYKSLSEGQNWSGLKIGEIIRQRKGFLLLANLVLSSFQRRMGMDLGTKPGEEMLKAVEVAQELGIPFSFSDREVQVTLRRAWGKSNFWNKNKLLAALLGSVFTKEKLTEEEMERLKNRNALEGMLEELSQVMPSVKEVLIDERDRFLAANIYNTQEKKVLAVIGAGHAPGIIRWLNDFYNGTAKTNLDDISAAPPPKKITKIIPWVIPVVVAGLLALGFFRSGWRDALSMLWLWVLVNGSLSAIGALAALAHPLTIVVAFAAAPITSLNPAIGVGIVTGLVEAYLRKPRVRDFENLQDDIGTIKGFYRNRLTRILLVFFLSTIGSAIGTFIGIPYLTSILT